MRLSTRKLMDRCFTGAGFVSIALVAGSLVVVLAPIAVRGATAFVFRATVEHRRLQVNKFNRGDPDAVEQEMARCAKARATACDMVRDFERQLARDRDLRDQYAESVREVRDRLRAIIGPLPGEPPPVLLRERYGQTRWDRAQVKLRDLLYVEQYDYSDPKKMGRKILVPRADEFKGTSLERLFPYVESHLADMMAPKLTLYWGFLFDESIDDAHFFGGIWAEVLGTLYLTVGAVLFAVPMGVISAIYLVEYAGEGRLVSMLRTCVSTLAGVPSIVFGLFGLAFFINGIRVSESKSVLAGSLTLAILILPIIIRASEEALLAVPQTYKEAALSLGASRWRAMVAVILPAALPGILTGIVISMGRAAGETAPIIFTAAVSMGSPLAVWQTASQPTPALPWNVYNLCTENAAVDEIRHVQYGMVLTLVALVLALNVAAIVLRARISRRLRGG